MLNCIREQQGTRTKRREMRAKNSRVRTIVSYQLTETSLVLEETLAANEFISGVS